MVRGPPVRKRYWIEGPFVLEGTAGYPVFPVVVQGVHRRSVRRRMHRDPPFFWVCAAQDGERRVLPFPAEALLGWAFQRWEVEVAHRE
jgi:hypothetical protein